MFVLSQIFFLAQSGTMGAMTRHGLGRHINIVTKPADVLAIQIVSQILSVLHRFKY